MSKHHIKDLAEQIANTGHASSPFHNIKKPNQPSTLMASGNNPGKIALEDSAIQDMAYQIYQDKGGTALGNWLEAEQIIKNSKKVVQET